MLTRDLGFAKGARPSGMVLVIGAGMLFCAAVSLMGFLLLTERALQKDRGLHLADSASLAAARWHAQILNYQAYANRAILANEIMMVQSLTLLSWVKHIDQLMKNAGTVSALFPPLRAVAQTMVQTSEMTRKATESGVRLEIPLRSAYTHALAASQRLMHDAATPFATQALVNEVIWTSDTGYFGQYLPTSDVSKLYFGTRAFSGDERAPYAKHITEALDGFTRSRGFDSRLYLLPTTGCVPTSIDRAFSRLVKRGGSGYEPDYSDISAVDTLSVHQWRKRSWWRPTCSGIGESFSLAWGAGSTTSTARLDGLGGASANPGATSRATAEATRVSGYLGLPSLWDVADPSHRVDYNAFRLSVLVSARDNSNGDQALGGARMRTVQMKLFPKSGRARSGYAVSTSEIYFDDRTLNGRGFLPNLFEPRWNARLVSTSHEDQLAAEIKTRLKESVQ
jgi:hypothetical protein